MTDGPVTFERSKYIWRWNPVDDLVRIAGRNGLEMLVAPQRPVLEFSDGSFSAGVVSDIQILATSIRVSYETADALSIIVTWRFEDECCWLEPVKVNDPHHRPIVRLHQFAGPDAVPSLICSHLVEPGVSAGAGVSPVIDSDARLSFSAWLGKGSTWELGSQQQTWALPTHYFAGQTVHGVRNQRDIFANALSDAFCAGLADLPAGDIKLVSLSGRYSVIFDYCEDIWGARDAETPISRGATWCWSFADRYRAAIAEHYRRLRQEGIVAPVPASPAKLDSMSMSQFNTWGAQVVDHSDGNQLTQEALDTILNGLQGSGMDPGCIIIDDKWEQKYGLLQHDEVRLPRFEQTIETLRTMGKKVGLWAAFLRCEDPAALGLEPSHMLCGRDGQPVVQRGGYADYYYPDVSQPVVAEALRTVARAFAERYRPDIVKFDFGYELPSLRQAAPKNRNFQGERFLELGLRAVVSAMREILPDVVIMGYSLSPLLVESLDLHAIDDIWLCTEEYEQEVNRRLFFSTLLGELGVPSYGSGGYDWPSMSEIWFDTVIAGPIGSLGSFGGDVIGSRPEPGDIAMFNGLSALTRRENEFEIEALRSPLLGASSAARSSSWARWESGRLTMIALRPRHFDGSTGISDFRGLVKSEVQIVLASRDERGISDASELGLVSYGNGLVHISRPTGGRAEIATHLSSGRVELSTAQVSAGMLTLEVSRVLGNDNVEWVQVKFVS